MQDPRALRRPDGALWISPGDRGTDESHMTQIDAIDRLQLLFTLPEQAVAAVRPGIPVKIKVAPYPTSASLARSTSSRPPSSPRPAHPREGVDPNPERRLRPGLFAEIEAEIDRRDDACWCPTRRSSTTSKAPSSGRWTPSRARTACRSSRLHQEGKVEVAKGLSSGRRRRSAGIRLGRRTASACAPRRTARTRPVAADARARRPS
jgi:membrane fusion protein (multidrug efflux system)